MYGIEHHEGPAKAGLFIESTAVATQQILNNECAAALIGPIDYARNSSDFSLYGSASIASRDDSRTIILCLKRDIRKIATIAIGSVSSSDIVLTKIVLSEKFEQEIAVVPFIGAVDEMLSKADAALLCGDAVLTSGWDGPRLDIVDEWTDMTDLPFVHLVCASRKEHHNTEIHKLLRTSQEKGISSLDQVAASALRALPVPVEVVEAQLERYSYGFNPDTREGLNEFFRYAFYHGIIPDVPELDIAGGEG